jgi:hypothetical protein
LTGSGTLGKSRLLPIILLSSAAAVVAFWSISSLGGGSTATAADPVVIFKNPASADLWLCDSAVAACDGPGQGEVVFAEEVTNVGTGLGSFEFTMYFSRGIIQVSVEEGPFLKSTGRQTQCQTIEMENGLRFGCTSTGGEPGPTGSGVLAYITVRPDPDLYVRPTAKNGILLRLLNDYWGAELADVMGNPIAIDSVGSATVLIQALEGDFNYDCQVNVIDEQAVSVRYGSFFGIWIYNTFYDLEPSIPDFDIDIKDLQFVYGRDGDSCEGEEETPTPTATSTPILGTATPTSTGTPPTATPTPTGTPPTAMPTPTGTPPTATPTERPTRTPVSKTTTPTATAAVTVTQTPTPATATPTPIGTIAPGEGTPPPQRTIAPEGRRPGEAEELPGAGTGMTSGDTASTAVLLAGALFAVAGCSLLAGILQLRQTGKEEE